MSNLNPQIQAVFTAFGRTAYSIQIFEADLISLIIMLRLVTETTDEISNNPEFFLKKGNIEKFWKKEAVRIQGQINKETLGQLLKNDIQGSIKKI